VFLTWAPLASLLDHDVPTLLGFVVASLAIPAVVAADTIDKWRRRPAGLHQAGRPVT
jgi:hypothetical protein